MTFGEKSQKQTELQVEKEFEVHNLSYSSAADTSLCGHLAQPDHQAKK